METFSNTELLEPIDLYQTRLKDAFHNNAIKYFEEMDKKAQINIDANQEACSRFYKESSIIDKLMKERKGKKGWKIAFIIFSIISAIGAIIMFVAGVKAIGAAPGYGIGAVLIALCIGLIVVAVKFGKKVKSIDRTIDEHRKKADTAKAEAYEIMRPLNDMFEWNMAANLMSNTTPLIQLDQVFDGKKYEMLHDKFGYDEDNSTNTSAVFVQSGSILGNPFVFEKNYCQTMAMHRYVGTRVISYTVRDSDGHSHTVTQTLTASVEEPEPVYYYDTTLVYGNDAAPRLSFSRKPTDINSMNEKQIEKYVASFDKKLDKKVDKSLKKGETFTRLANEEFEALFNALDRNNETEFRLLFTPLGQRNMIKLLKGKEVGFGDDFAFRKIEKLNYVTCAHMQGSDSLDKDPATLMSFDYKNAKEIFVNYADKYLKDIFFNLAPLISIPVYQQHKTIDYIYKGTFKHNVTKAEAEAAANAHSPSLFKHPDTRSAGVILKSKFIKAVDKADLCNITAHSFSGTDRVTYVPVMGGDGHMHDVPVNWIEYNPISMDTQFVVTDTETNLPGYRALQQSGKFNDIINKFPGSNDMLYKKRLFSFVLKDNK